MKTLIQFFVLIVLVSACRDEEVRPEPSIVHRDLHEVKAGYLTPFLLDVDLDGTFDYSFSVSLIGSSGSEERHFRMVPLWSNRALVANDDVIPLDEGAEVAVYKHFAKFVESLAVKTTASGVISWSGNWKDASGKFVGLDFKGNDGHSYFGWVRLSFSQNEEKIIVHELAYSRPSQSMIKAGQTEADQN